MSGRLYVHYSRQPTVKATTHGDSYSRLYSLTYQGTGKCPLLTGIACSSGSKSVAYGVDFIKWRKVGYIDREQVVFMYIARASIQPDIVMPYTPLLFAFADEIQATSHASYIQSERLITTGRYLHRNNGHFLVCLDGKLPQHRIACAIFLAFLLHGSLVQAISHS